MLRAVSGHGGETQETAEEQSTQNMGGRLEGAGARDVGSQG